MISSSCVPELNRSRTQTPWETNKARLSQFSPKKAPCPSQAQAALQSPLIQQQRAGQLIFLHHPASAAVKRTATAVMVVSTASLARAARFAMVVATT